MVKSSTPGIKRKNPPSFQHLPINRAITLKKAWVAKTKIKSKWKAEKRKEGLDSTSRLELPVDENEDRDKSPEEDRYPSESGSDAPEEPSASTTASTVKERRPQASVMHPSRAHIHPTVPVKNQPSTKNEAGDSKPVKRQRTKRVEEETAPPSLRELTKQAYSKETLHTYKSDPLKKHRNASNGGARGGRAPAPGRGQPNMKLRMNAMLAKIKQDFA